MAVFATDGKIGRIMLPERCANLCFGGRKRNRLFMAASQSIYAVYVETQVLSVGKRRRVKFSRDAPTHPSVEPIPGPSTGYASGDPVEQYDIS